MWAVIPPLPSQPVVDLIADRPSRVIHYGWAADNGTANGLYRVSVAKPYFGSPVTLVSALPNVHAVHVMAKVDGFTDFSICLGSRYRLTVKSYTNTDPLHPFLANGSRCMRASIEDGQSPIATADMPFVTYPSGYVYPDNSGLVVCFGYAFDQGQLKAYSHVSSHRSNPLQQIQDGPVPSCGSGTASLLVDVNAEDALAGTMSLVVREPAGIEAGDQTPYGGLEFLSMACRIGPFLSVASHMQELWSTKSARAGTRVASLRSIATNFSQPMATGGFLISPQRGNAQGVADVDCGGHAEFSRSSRFAVSLAGQPDPDIAYVAASPAWRGNCGFTEQQLQRMSLLRIAVSSVFGADVSFSCDIAATVYGNNEYAGSTPQSSDAWDTLHVQVRVSGYEDVDDYSATPIGNVVVRSRVVVTVSVFASLGGIKGGQSSASVTLNESEANAFFGGGSISLAGGSITVTPVG